MKLMKSPAKKLFIFMYYAILFIADFLFITFIIFITDSILAGIGIGLVLSVGIGILGGELEYREHMKEKRGNGFSKRRDQEEEEQKKILYF